MYHIPRPITAGNSWTENIFEASVGGHTGNFRVTVEIVDNSGAAAECEILTVTTAGLDITYSHFPGGPNPLVSSADIGARSPVAQISFNAGDCGGPSGTYALKSWTIERTSGWPT